LDIITQNTIIFYLSLLIPIVAIFILSNNWSIGIEKFVLQYLSAAYLVFIVILIGFRKIGVDGFADTQMYINWFNDSQLRGIINTKDIGFGLWTYLLSYFVGVRLFFFLCTLLSFFLLIWVSFKVAREQWLLMILGFMVSLYFWNNEVFTIRQGLASNFMLVAIFSRPKYAKVFFSLLAISFHLSFAITAFAFLIVSHFKNSKFYFFAWLLILLVSSAFNNQIFLTLSKILQNERLTYYLGMDMHSNLNFRWDVVLFSLVFICIGFYNIIFKGFNKDNSYRLIINLFIFSNLFLLLLGKSNIMHRFAFLSWFLIPLIVFYPILKNKLLFTYSRYLVTLGVMYIFILTYTFYKIYTQNMKFVPDVANNEIRMSENIFFTI